MSIFRAVLWLDHREAHLVRLDPPERMRVHNLYAHPPDARQPGGAARTEEAFFGSVCDALTGIKEVLVTAPNLAQAAFRRYVEKHRPALMSQIVGWDTVAHPTEAQLVALAHQFYARLDRITSRAAQE